MATDNQLFQIDTIVVDGAPIAFETASARLTGAARFENEVRLSATGDDFQMRKRIPCTAKANIQFGAATNPGTFTAQQNVQITMRDSQSGRRVLLTRCSFAKMGEIGNGAVEVEWNVLTAPQWL